MRRWLAWRICLPLLRFLGAEYVWGAFDGDGLPYKLYVRQERCGRCTKRLEREGEVCWYCLGTLCGACWEAYGHCGHEEAIAANEGLDEATYLGPLEGTRSCQVPLS